LFYILVMAETIVAQTLIQILSETTDDEDIDTLPQTYAQLVGKIPR